MRFWKTIERILDFAAVSYGITILLTTHDNVTRFGTAFALVYFTWRSFQGVQVPRPPSES
jgi:uncharacterized membrane protein